MQSGQSPEPHTRFGDDGPNNPSEIPDFARSWGSVDHVASVRRPSTHPDPSSYHEVIEPQAIFELDEEQEDGTIKTILVVPFSCKQCKSLRQACSRARPACARCRKGGRACQVAQEGYQCVPPPKIEKPSYKIRKQDGTSGTGTNSMTLSTQDLTAGGSRPRRVPSRVVSLPLFPSSDSGSPVASGSKRPLSPESASVPPRKKAPAKSACRKREARYSTVAPLREASAESSEVPATDSSMQVASADERSVLEWTFVHRHEKTLPGPGHDHPTLSNTLLPRVWTNTLSCLLTVFPELGKSTTGFSWFQSETPVLLLDTNYDRGCWVDSTTLNIDLLWDFSCLSSELEPFVESNAGGLAQFHSRQPKAYPSENTLDHETMISRDSHTPSEAILFPAHTEVSVPLPTFNMQMLFSNGAPQGERATLGSSARGSNSVDVSARNNSTPTDNTHIYPPNLPFPPEGSPSSHMYFWPNVSLAHHATSLPACKPQIPLSKPQEVETLLDSHLRFAPLLLWLPHDSGLAPHNLSQEYAYICMGLFFISDLQHGVVQHDVSSTTGFVRGRVRWSVTLQWAPGGEDALFDRDSTPSMDGASDSRPVGTTRNLQHPWWFDPTDTPLEPDNTTRCRPRDLRMQFYSFIPLDLLAEFHPSESFPRGWFCKSCGMINIQVYFRHQICQSTICRSARGKQIPPGKVDLLSSLRDLYQSNTLIHPTDNIPPVVASDIVTWDDGMQSWIYTIKDGVTAYHIFTGNQESLQQDSTALLERIQCEVLLRKQDPASPYFTHSTRLLHSSDGSDTRVPGGTPNCVRTAYYMLRDFVHRYGEMDGPRFGEVRMQAWISSGSKKGSVFRASKLPVIVHCLGAETVLNLTPKGGYKDTANFAAPVNAKGKGRAHDGDLAGSPSTAPSAGPSRCQGQDNGNQTQFIPGPDTHETPIVAENVVDAVAAMDTVSHCHSHNAGGIEVPNSNTSPGMGVTQNQVVEGSVRKKNKVTKDRAKATVPEISMTLVHGDCVVLCGDDFECQIVRSGTTVLVIGLPEET